MRISIIKSRKINPQERLNISSGLSFRVPYRFTTVNVLSRFYTQLSETHRKQSKLQMQSNTLKNKILKQQNLQNECRSYVEIIQDQILSFGDDIDGKDTIQILKQMIYSTNRASSNFYDYENIQKEIKIFINFLKNIRSFSLSFKSYVFVALCFYQFCSYTLSIYYLDKGLKILNDQSIIYPIQRIQQLIIYKTASKIFYKKGLLPQSKQLAYKYLRKSWYLNNIDEQLSAYDFLGIIQNELQNSYISQYFHNRMCNGTTQKNSIKKMSNYQLDKSEKQKIQYTSYQDIIIFIKNDQKFNQILANHYKSQAKQYLEYNKNHNNKSFKNHRKYLLTHRSPNRISKNYHGLQRKTISDKKSKQIHFIKPVQIKFIKKLFIQFIRFIVQIKKNLQKIQLYGIQSCSKYSDIL